MGKISPYVTDEKAIKGPDGQELVVRKYDKVQGAVTVEMRDVDTGRLTHHEHANNFIAPQWAISSRSWQRLAWGKWSLNTDFGIDYPQNAWVPYQFPNSYLGCWYDGAAESSSTEHSVRTNEDGIVAWASRLPVGSPSGSRGVVNTSTSDWTLGAESMVYDWPSTAGNGTFRSVGYTELLSSTGASYTVPLIRPNPSERKYVYDSGTISSLFGSANYTALGNVGLDDSDNLIVPLFCNSPSQFGWWSIPSSVWDQSWSFDASGAAEDSAGGTFVTGKTLTSMGGRVHFLGAESSHYWFGYIGSSNTCRFARMNTSTYAVDKAVNMGGTTNYGIVGGMIGTDLFVMKGQADSDYNKVYRYDTTATPPTLTATISLSVPNWFSSSTHYPTSMFPDGTNLWVYFTGIGSAVGGWYHFDTSGNCLAHHGIIESGAHNETASSPYAGTRQEGGFGVWQGFSVNRPTSTGWVNSSGTSFGNYGGSGMGCGNGNLGFWANSELIGINFSAVTSPSNRIVLSFAQLGHNLGSRVLLGSDTTKTSSNTMKITYDVTLPDFI